MAKISCAATLCFIPGIVICTNIAEAQPLPQLEQSRTVQHSYGVFSSPIKVSSYQPGRHLTEVEQKVLKQALLRSVKVVDQGYLSI